MMVPRDLPRRFEPLREGRGLSPPESLPDVLVGLLLGLDLAGLSSPPPGMRSATDSRRSASAAGSPNSGSLRPPLFFRPHAIRNAHTLMGGTLAFPV